MEAWKERDDKKDDVEKKDSSVMHEVGFTHVFRQISSHCNSTLQNLSTSPKAVAAETMEIKGPLVFQCARCKTIVGDSFSLICSHEGKCVYKKLRLLDSNFFGCNDVNVPQT